MWWYPAGITAVAAQLFLPPAITDRIIAFQSEFGPVYPQVLILITHIKKADCLTAIFEFFHPYLLIVTFDHTNGLFTGCILVNSIYFIIAEQVEGELIHTGNITADQ